MGAKASYDSAIGDVEQRLEPSQSRINNTLWKCLAISSLTLNVLLISFLLSIPWTPRKPWPTSADSSCVKKTSAYSPLLEDLDLKTSGLTINGSLFPNCEPPSVWRSPPSADVDIAWDQLSRTDIFAISHSDVVALGRDSDLTVPVPASYGFGSDIYLAELDGQHHLHCLNMIRKYAYLPYYFPQYPDMTRMPVFHQNHLNHCIDILRQQLLCSMSTDIITYRWVEGQSIPQPDFSVNKVCKNQEQISNWLEKKWSELPLSDDQKVNVPRPGNVKDIDLASSPYWDTLVRKAREKGVSIHEYVE